MTIMVPCAQHQGVLQTQEREQLTLPRGPARGGFVHCPSDPNGCGFNHFKVTHPKLRVSLEFGNKYQGLFKWHLGHFLGRGWQPCSACQELPKLFQAS